jgi:hypothetical protein
MHYTHYMLLVLASNAFAWEPSAKFIEAVAQVESGGDSQAIGDKGKARGTYQFHKAAWTDCTTILSKAGAPTASWSTGAMNEATARLYFTTYCMHIARRLEKDGLTPNNGSVYLCYTMGYNGAKKIRFLIDKAPQVKKSSVTRVITLSN